MKLSSLQHARGLGAESLSTSPQNLLRLLLADNSELGRGARIHFHGGRAWCLLDLGACRSRGGLDGRSSRGEGRRGAAMQHIFYISRSPKSLGGLLEAGCGFLPETCKMHKYRNKTDKQGNVGE